MNINNFYDALGKDEQVFFTYELPVLVSKWFRGKLMGKQASGKLPLMSAYTDIDALAVALLHLKPYFPPREPRVLYRLIHEDRLPMGDTYKLPSSYRLLTSWTDFPGHLDGFDAANMVLVWPHPGKQLLANTDSAYSMCSSVFQMLRKRGEDKGAKLWRVAMDSVDDRQNEEEFVCYLKAGQTFNWRPWDPDEDSAY